jgi:hypothetical protein
MANDGSGKGAAPLQVVSSVGAAPPGGANNQQNSGGPPQQSGAAYTQYGGASPPGGGGAGPPGGRAPRAKLDRVDTAIEYHIRRLETIDQRFEPQITAADDVFTEATETWAHVFSQVDRQPRYQRAGIYLPVLGLCTLLEIPLNRLAFELFIRENPLASFGIALLVGLIFMTLAHFVGVTARRFSYSLEQGRIWPSVLAIVGPLLAIAALAYCVAMFRQGYLRFETQPDPSFSQMLENDQVMQAAIFALQGTLGVDGWGFWFLNMALVLAGVAWSFVCHDPHPDFQKADVEKKASELELSKLRTKKGKALAAEKLRHAIVLRRLKA